MLNKIIGVIILFFGIILLSTHTQVYAFDRLDQDTPLTAPTQQTCSANQSNKAQLCWKDGSHCLVGGNVSPVVEPEEMAAVTADDTRHSQINAAIESTDQQNSITSNYPQAIFATAQNSTPTNEPTLKADLIFQMINQYRASLGLPAFVQDGQICAVAASRAPELYKEIMVTHTMHRGFYARNLPYWATENIIYMNSEQAAVTWWINDPIHHAAIVSNNKYSCVACSGKSCSEIFTSYVMK